jgi:hypothetical protein
MKSGDKVRVIGAYTIEEEDGEIKLMLNAYGYGSIMKL